jgi:cytochrome c oxidase subunit 2
VEVRGSKVRAVELDALACRNAVLRLESRKADVRPDERTRSRHAGRLTALAAASLLALTGCSQAVERGWMPGEPGVTDETDRITHLWVGSWIAALAVGVLTWGLIIWAVVAYRRRKDETGLPAQVRYNVPVEMLYTVVPVFIVGGLFYFTARDQTIIEEERGADVHVNVVGKQWSWDFNYVDEDVFETGIQIPLDGTDAPEEIIPTLYLPVDERVEILLTSRDVIHSFWVIDFLYKKDVIPGRENVMEFTPQEEGLYIGKCAELCGEFHSEMLFNVEVVSRERYDEEMENLRDAGQTGQLETELGRSDGTDPRGDDEVREDEIGEESGREDQ